MVLNAVAAIANTSTQMPLLATPPLLHHSVAAHFFVCGSGVDGLDGKYVLEHDANNDNSGRARWDADTPMFVRDDDNDDDTASSTSLATLSAAQSDMRLFRYNGFWMFADVGAWPPTTHFRCDPTQQHRVPTTVELQRVCARYASMPPHVGYTSARLSDAQSHLALSSAACACQLGVDAWTAGPQ